MATQRVQASPKLTDLPPAEVQPVSASPLDTLRVATRIVAPTVATGVIKRRPRAMALAQRLQLDGTAIGLMRRLRDDYGPGPLHLRMPGRSFSLLLDPAQVGELLAETPTPFSPDTTEKAAALRHFQPHGVLISTGSERADRRELNEAVLEPGRAVHELATPWAKVIREEARQMLSGITELDAERFTEHFWAVIRRIVLGGDTTADRRLTDLLDELRLDANWAYTHRRHAEDRHRFLNLLRVQLELGRPDSLGTVLLDTPAEPGVDKVGQVPHWLFAFDAAVIVTLRALALLATHPEELAKAHREVADADLDTPQQLPYLRSCVLESIRLWPTTPALLRESTQDTPWGPAATTFLVYTPFFHRDRETLPYADSFEPDIWLDGRAAANPALVPFSGGPAVCPGRDVVLFTTSMLLASLLQEADFAPQRSLAGLRPKHVPATLDHFGLRFTVK